MARTSAQRCGLLVAALLFGPLAHAQSLLTGSVHRLGEDSTRLRDVVVTLTPGERTARTDSLGNFRFAELPPGDYLLGARRLGYEAAFKTIRVTAGSQTTLAVAMASIAERMATITISGKRVTYPVRLAEPYARAARSTGHFFTREQIDSLFPLDVKSLLMRVPGVRLRSDAVEFARCTELGSSNQHIQVWLDGVRYTNYSAGTDLEVRANEAIRDIPPSSIQLMEIYSGVSRIPVDYLDDACAVILIWRK